jgi:hypothetical protein
MTNERKDEEHAMSVVNIQADSKLPRAAAEAVELVDGRPRLV